MDYFQKPVSTGFGLKALALVSEFKSTLKRAENLSAGRTQR
jgi:hypothetical protein